MSKAGLRDFDYMKDVTSITELRKQMRLTGAEVLPKKIHCLPEKIIEKIFVSTSHERKIFGTC